MDHDAFITSLIRGFGASSGDSNVDPDDYFFHLIRQAPEPPLLDLLRRYFLACPGVRFRFRFRVRVRVRVRVRIKVRV